MNIFFLRALRTTMLKVCRSLRKFEKHSHHEGREGHEAFGDFLIRTFVLLCLKVFSICANHAAKAVSFSVLALRAANNAVITFRPFSVTM